MNNREKIEKREIKHQTKKANLINHRKGEKAITTTLLMMTVMRATITNDKSNNNSNHNNANDSPCKQDVGSNRSTRQTKDYRFSLRSSRAAGKRHSAASYLRRSSFAQLNAERPRETIEKK